MAAPRSFRPLAAVLAVAACGALAAVYYLVDPAESCLMPRCIFHTITGLQCPGCGSQRLLHALLHGDLQGAWRANALLLVGLPFIALMAVAEFFPRRVPRLFALLHSPRSIAVIAGVIAAWGVVRNL